MAGSTDRPAQPALRGLTVLERGWLSSNNILLHDEAGAVLVDSGHVVHAEQTVALVRHALAANTPTAGGAPAHLRRIVNTHVHSDHCSGNAALQRATGAGLTIPPWQAQAVERWDDEALSYAATGQLCERYSADATLAPGQRLQAGGRAWEAVAAPGHDPDSLMLFDARDGVLISADALWGNGFGVVFPAIDGRLDLANAFDDVAEALATIERLDAALVIPGHGPVFTDVADALARARRRLEGFRREPLRHNRYAAKVLVKYHVMERGSVPLAELHAWAVATPLVQRLWQGSEAGRTPLLEWFDAVLGELADGGAVRRRDDRVHDA